LKVPHGLPASAFTTTSATTASRMIMISSTVNNATKPPSVTDLLARHLSQRLCHRGAWSSRMTKSCTRRPKPRQ
jgi:hypothetical protein